MLDFNDYGTLVDTFHERLTHVTEEQASIKLSEEKWTLKEIIGHLIDSASNNHQRFVRLQFGDLRGFPAYDGEQWVKIQQYNRLDWDRLILLWHSYNLLVLHVIRHTENSALSNVWEKDDVAIPLGELIVDYYRHMKVHIEQFESRLREGQDIGHIG